MAINTKRAATKSTTDRGNGRRQADGFLNLHILQADGTKVAIQTGIPLFAGQKLGRSLISKAESDPEFEYQLVGTVHVVSEDDESATYEF